MAAIDSGRPQPYISDRPSIEWEQCSPPTCPTLGKVVQTRDGPATRWPELYEAHHAKRSDPAVLHYQ